MIRLFDVENKVLIPTEHCFALRFLRKIMDDHPDDYIEVYKYLFYMTCPDPDLNPFFHVPEVEKEDLILDEIDAEFSTEDSDIIDALAKCNKLYETETSRAYTGIKKMLDKISIYMADTPITDGRDGNLTQIVNTAKSFDGIRQSYKGVYKDLQEEQESKVRGSQMLAYDSK